MMKEEKHLDALKEVEDTIKKALESKNLIIYQRRLAMMISLGMQQLIELYFHRLDILKPGCQLKHEWFGRKEEHVKERIEPLLTTKLEQIENIHQILAIARKIEEDRNELAYGSPVSKDKVLRQKINLYYELKKLIE